MQALEFMVEWQGVTLEVHFKPCLWQSTSHLEIRCIAPERAALPITETGYKSLFLPIGSLPDDEDELRAHILDWLDRAARSAAWISALASAAQGELF